MDARSRKVGQAAGRPPRNDAIDRRQKILDEAIRLYAERGFDGVTIADIAAQSDVAKSLVNHHFGGKEALRKACDRYALAEMKETLSEAEKLLNRRLDPAGMDDLMEWTRNASQLKIHVRRYLTMMFLSRSEGSTEIFEDYFHCFYAFILGLERTGKLRDDIDPVWAAMSLIFFQLGSVFLSPYIEILIQRNPFDPDVVDRRAHTLMAIFQDGVVPRKPTEAK